MRSTTYSPGGVQQKFSRLLPEATLNRLAVESGFLRRAARRCTPFYFVLSFFSLLSKGRYALSSWAGQLAALSGATLAKQSLAERLNAGSARFALRLLSYLLRRQHPPAPQRAVGAFSAVLLQDSTTVPLQDSLQPAFKGNCSHGVAKALVRKNTLVLRDRGYWSVESLRKIAGRGACFLSRLRYGMNLYDEHGHALPLKDLLHTKALERRVQLCAGYRLNVRLLVVPLPALLAAERVRRARTHRDYRLHHSAAYYRFCRYQVFITNATAEQLPLEAAAEVYRLRWQVEVWFKALKSAGLQLPRLVRDVKTNAERIRTTVALALCFVVLTSQQLAWIVHQTAGALSLLKLINWALANLWLLVVETPTRLQTLVAYYCGYEKRKRKGLREKLRSLS